MKSRKVLRKMCVGLVAASLAAVGLGTVQASAANVLTPMLLSFSELPGIWAPDSQDCNPATYQGLIRSGYGARDAVETCFDNGAQDIVDETLGLYTNHLAAEAEVARVGCRRRARTRDKPGQSTRQLPRARSFR